MSSEPREAQMRTAVPSRPVTPIRHAHDRDDDRGMEMLGKLIIYVAITAAVITLGFVALRALADRGVL